jgi:hypothetical protein
MKISVSSSDAQKYSGGDSLETWTNCLVICQGAGRYVERNPIGARIV